MLPPGSFNVLMMDEFLPEPLLADLLGYAIDRRILFSRSKVREGGQDLAVSMETRRSWSCDAGLGPHAKTFCEKINAHLDTFLDALGIQPFAIGRTELELVAHSDSGFFTPHIDTPTGEGLNVESSDCIISAVFYFYREPKRFTGGEIAIYSLKPGDPVELLEPRQNRLVVFPSFAPHEVHKVSCPSGDFADSRFSINCWLHRTRREQRHRL